MPVRVVEQAGRRQLVGGVGGEALRRVVAEDDHQFIGFGRLFELTFQPFELGVVDVAVGGEVAGRGDDRARLGDRVEGDEAHSRIGLQE